MAEEKKESQEIHQTEPQEIKDGVDAEEEKQAEEPVEAEDAAGDSRRKKILSDTVENIESGAKVVGKTVNEVVDKLKKGASEAIKSGSKVVNEFSQTAQVYAEKYKAEIDIHKLKQQKDKQLKQLGAAIYKQYKADGKVKKTVFRQVEISNITGKVKDLDQKIVEIGRELDKSKEQQ